MPNNFSILDNEVEEVVVVVAALVLVVGAGAGNVPDVPGPGPVGIMYFSIIINRVPYSC